MRKIRRFLQVLLFINFMVGLHDKMRAGNLVLILINGAIVLAIIFAEKKGSVRWQHERRNTGEDTGYRTTGNGGSDR